MSDFVIQIIPADPQHMPADAQLQAARHWLQQALPAAERVEVQRYAQIRFIDAGENWDGVRCPACGEDAEGWWIDAVSAALGAEPVNLQTVAPCCGASVGLHQMDHGWPVGFARCVIEAWNPDVPKLEPAQLQQVQALLGCPLTLVLAYI